MPKFLPDTLLMSNATFNEVVKHAVKDTVLTYNAPDFDVTDVSWNAGSSMWEIELATKASTDG